MSALWRNRLPIKTGRIGNSLCSFALVILAALAACATSPLRWQQLPRQVINDTAFRHYATVTRVDGSTRHMLIDEATLRHWQPGQPMPTNTLIVMQTWLTDTESTGFTKHMQADGNFSYGAFNPTQPNFATRVDNTCASCHEVSEDVPGTFTLPMLNAAVAQGWPMLTQCNRAGRIPCEAHVYHNFVPEN